MSREVQPLGSDERNELDRALGDLQAIASTAPLPRWISTSRLQTLDPSALEEWHGQLLQACRTVIARVTSPAVPPQIKEVLELLGGVAKRLSTDLAARFICDPVRRGPLGFGQEHKLSKALTELKAEAEDVEGATIRAREMLTESDVAQQEKYSGRTLTAKEAADILGITVDSLIGKVRRGKDAHFLPLTTPQARASMKDGKGAGGFREDAVNEVKNARDHAEAKSIKEAAETRKEIQNAKREYSSLDRPRDSL